MKRPQDKSATIGGLRSLVLLRQSPHIDWTHLIQEIGSDFSGHAALILYELGPDQSLASSRLLEPPIHKAHSTVIDTYRHLSSNKEWLEFIRVSPPATFKRIEILPDRSGERRAAETSLDGGMGAVLWKDRDPGARRVLAIIVARAENYDDKDEFCEVALFMELAIGRYPANLLSLPRLIDNTDFTEQYKLYLLQRGLTGKLASQAMEGLREFLQERSLKILPADAAVAKDQARGQEEIETASIRLPAKAPALWERNRVANEPPTAFIKRHYAPWLGKGLLRSDIRRLDPVLYAAMNVWLSRHPEEAKELQLPKKKEHTDTLIDDVFAGDAVKVGLLSSDPADRRKAIHRLSDSIRYREKKTPRRR
jgi:hypothetical protein